MSTTDEDFRCMSAPPGRFLTPSQTTPRGDRDISVNHHPYSHEGERNGNQPVVNGNGSHGNHRFMQQVLVEGGGERMKRPKSAAPAVSERKTVHKTSSYREAHKVYTKPLPRKPFEYEHVNNVTHKSSAKHNHNGVHSKPRPINDLELILNLQDSVTTSEKSGTTVTSSSGHNKDNGHSRHHSTTTADTESICTSDSDLDDDVTVDQEQTYRSLTARERDEMLSEIITVGDRVLISCPQKPPRYGKKRGRS